MWFGITEVRTSGRIHQRAKRCMGVRGGGTDLGPGEAVGVLFIELSWSIQAILALCTLYAQVFDAFSADPAKIESIKECYGVGRSIESRGSRSGSEAA